MSEKLSSRPEQRLENIDTSKELERLRESVESQAEKTEGVENNIEQITKQAEAEAISGKEITLGERERPASSPISQQKELKNAAFTRTLQRIQNQLPGPQKLFSKVIHNPTIDKVSAFGAQTVARPSGVMGGGLLALVGSSTVLYFSKRYGFSYNYTLFIALFAGGFLLGLLFELIVKLIKRK